MSLRQIPNTGIGYGTLRGRNVTLHIVTFSYLGQFNKEDRPQDSQGLWSISL